MMKETSKKSIVFVSVAVMCFLVYLASYTTKNLLSVNSPLMIRDGYDSVAIGAMSSIYFFCYGAGQLFVGFIGDRINLKYMLLMGLGIAGAACFSFASIDSIVGKSISWGVCGFGLSFLYAPLVRCVADRLEGKRAETCMVILEVASVLGSSVAGVFGALGNWKVSTFIFAVILAFIAVVSFVFNTVFDKKFPVVKRVETEKNTAMPMKGFVRYWLSHGAVAFILISAIQGIANNSITFWIPTYISDFLGFEPEIASVIFLVMMLISAVNQIIAIGLYHLMRGRMIWVVRLAFFLSTVCFLALILVKNAYANLVLFLLAKSGYGWAGAMMWTFYCRKFNNVHRVAFVVGFLDFVSYLFSAISSVLFSSAIEKVGWTYLIVIWASIMAAGILATLLYRTKKIETKT